MSPETDQIMFEARDSLRNAGVWKALLFGSRSRRGHRSDSDVDLVVILNRSEPFRSFAERSAALVDIRSRLSGLSCRYGLDLLLFTRPEWEAFIQRESSFSK